MAPRSFWKGYLKLSLVTCPVAMTPATSEGERVRFHTLNRATGNRIATRYVDVVTGKSVAEADEVKGYQRGDDFVVLEDDEIDAVALESTKTIDISTFVAKDTIDWVWCDKPHYLFPDDEVGEQAYFADVGSELPTAKMLGLITALIDKGTKPWSAEMVSDPVQNRLLEIIAAKDGKRPATKAKPKPEGGAEVINIMDALRKSLGPAGAARKR
jgi:DNA end-binding protein Ku